MSGYNYRLDALQAAVLHVKLKHLEDWIGLRREKAESYDRLLAGSHVATPIEREYSRHVYTYYVIRSPERDSIQNALQ